MILRKRTEYEYSISNMETIELAKYIQEISILFLLFLYE